MNSPRHVDLAGPARRRGALLRPLLVAALALMATPAFASSSSTTMPWDSFLTSLKDDLTGPVATTVAVIACVIFGLSMAMGQEGSSMKKGMTILFGLALAFTGATTVVSLFGGSSGAVF